MSKQFWSGACALLFCSAVAVSAAQDPQTGQSGAASGKSMTVTGCIQRAEKAATGTSGTTAGATGVGETKFVLTSAMASPSAAGTAGTAGAAASAVANEYRLDGDEAKLSPHVGHKVEITGTAAKASAAAPPSTASAAASPKLKVDSIKMISATCP